MRKRTRWLVSLSILALGSWFLYRENNVIDVSRMTVTSNRLPEAFDGYHVVQVADLHGKAFGSEQQRLLKKIDRAKPDLVVMTGDLIDSRRNGEEAALTLMKSLVDHYPVYFVTGNHEVRRNLTILPKLEQLGVTILRNESRIIEYKGQSISLLGIDDPTTTRWREGLSEPDGIRQSLDQVLQDVSPDTFQLLLAHRPEYKTLYAERSIDLVLSGHAHGGQIRLPFTEGLYAPGQGFFPQVTAGRYREEKTELIVSRGLGNSLFPFRLFNHPELVVVTLKRP
ncbi:metallophosphoesterase [Exiguobacterium acetylicum]